MTPTPHVQMIPVNCPRKFPKSFRTGIKMQPQQRCLDMLRTWRECLTHRQNQPTTEQRNKQPNRMEQMATGTSGPPSILPPKSAWSSVTLPQKNRRQRNRRTRYPNTKPLIERQSACAPMDGGCVRNLQVFSTPQPPRM